MKKILTSIVIFLYFYGNAQTTNVIYKASTATFPNPERGFYKFTSASSSGSYQGLSQSTLTNFRLNNNITLIYREFKLDAFVNSPISSSYLANMQSDFDVLRKSGLKAFIRFTYSDNETVAQRDASKATILSHISQLKQLLQANSDVISLMQAGFIGTWGEWYYTSQAEFGGGGYNGSSLTASNISNRREVVDAMLSALPTGRMVQVRTPAIKRDLYSSTAIADSQGYNQTNVARVGHFNDCFLASSTDYGTYANSSVEYPYLAQDTKFTPMGGETCALNSPRSDCASAISEMAKFHWSFLNSDYNSSVLSGFTNGGCYAEIQQKLGYRFALTNATFPQAIKLGSTLPITLKIVNQGFAAPFNERKAYIVLKNLTTNQVYPVLMNADPRLWIGTNELTITENLTLPSNLTTGNYKLYLSIPDLSTTLASKPEYAIQFANQNIWDSTTGYNDLNFTLNVTSSLGTADNHKLNMSIYPVPTNNELTIELENLKDYNVSVFNSLGQKVTVASTSEANKMTINTGSLSTGLYFVSLEKGSFKDTRKIIVKH
ncbi:T9SS type A sorting domain-containing protein [Flavobacterium psychrotolerans]|uniref:Secretion system C-terminal sorting domain-containing protein n=1 Tax=Flavobacterium psychrotolerans TaxID=2169410 RepID=A0A2U1JLC4_9FLAO|nr:DUF4832 domain-containing protein [Flavobacterium psychrotolerans]PWA05942.1 hypothetical protein DB895_05850 [Flavobacterium psychrotolerans]